MIEPVLCKHDTAKKSFYIDQSCKIFKLGNTSLDKGQRTYKINEKQWKCYEVSRTIDNFRKSAVLTFKLFFGLIKRVNYKRYK